MIRLRKRLEPGAVGKIAEAIGKDASYISRMLSLPDKAGHKRITEDFVDLLDVALPGWLLSGEGPMRDSTHHQHDASQIGTPKRTMIDIMDELSEQIAKADPSVRDEIARLVMSYIDKPEGKSRIAQAIKALLSDHADSGV